MSYYRICPICGAYLDPGERCDCAIKKTAPEAGTFGDGKNREKWNTVIIARTGGYVNGRA